MADRVYCYPDSDVLVNKLNIKEREKLHIFERKLTMLRLIELIDDPIEGDFDFDHLKRIHRYIFQDIYDWAGEIRKVNIAKGNMFCNAKFIEEQAQEIFEKLKKENYLQGLSEAEFVKRLAYFFAELNALHPFREGNGRAGREFIRSLANKNGYIIFFADISEAEMLKASQESFLCKYEAMEELFANCIRKKYSK